MTYSTMTGAIPSLILERTPWIHPRVAVRNAEKITTLTAKEKDIIIKHMWGATLIPPKYPEGFIVTAVDKISAVDEYSHHLVDKVERMVRSAY